MNKNDLDALIARSEKAIEGNYLSQVDALALVAELKIYRAMALRLERAVHDLVKEKE